MKEIVLTEKKKGMAVLLGVIALYVLAILGVLAFCAQPRGAMVALLVLSIAVLALGWIPLCGLKVLKPQEALVLTLFGKYIGTLKGEGFYFVNPFCTAVNPAAKTKLNQSADVDGGKSGIQAAISAANQASNETVALAMQISQNFNETMDAMMSSWESRNKSQDILSQKQSDAILGYERVYDTETGEIYKATNGFSDVYDGERYRSVTEDDMYAQPISGYIEKVN